MSGAPGKTLAEANDGDKAAGIHYTQKPTYVFAAGDTPCDCTDEATTQITVGRTFFDDHADRACLRHDVEGVRLAGNKVRLFLRPCDVTELRSDADHYASSASDYGPDYFGLCSSARATVRAIDKLSPTPTQKAGETEMPTATTTKKAPAKKATASKKEAAPKVAAAPKVKVAKTAEEIAAKKAARAAKRKALRDARTPEQKAARAAKRAAARAARRAAKGLAPAAKKTPTKAAAKKAAAAQMTDQAIDALLLAKKAPAKKAPAKAAAKKTTTKSVSGLASLLPGGKAQSEPKTKSTADLKVAASS